MAFVGGKKKASGWNRSSAGMSVRLTCGRSWVRAPSVPLSEREPEASEIPVMLRRLQFHLCAGVAEWQTRRLQVPVMAT